MIEKTLAGVFKVVTDEAAANPAFGKRMEENYPLLRRFHELHELYFPLIAGVSRKSWVGRALSTNGHDAPVSERAFGTLGAEVTLAITGAHIIRTHNVKACVEAFRVADLVAG